jgi:hypothetical protein
LNLVDYDHTGPDLSIRLLETAKPDEAYNLKGRKFVAVLLYQAIILAKITGHTIGANANTAFLRPNDVCELSDDNTRLKGLFGDWQAYDLEVPLGWMLKECALSNK